MKRVSIILTVAIALFSLEACAKKEASEPSDVQFQIRLSSGTKTWSEGDRVRVFHRVSGNDTFIDDGAFTLSASSGNIFEGKLAKGLSDDKTYDWKVIYPYTEDGKASIGTDYLVLKHYGDQSYIFGQESLPLMGTLAGSKAGGTVSVDMKGGYVTAAVKIVNNGMFPVPVNSVKAGSTTVFINEPEEIAEGASVTILVPMNESEAKGKCQIAVNGSANSVEVNADAGQTCNVEISYKAYNTSISDSKVYSGNRYSTFTSMAHFGKKFYVAFRESDTEYCHHGAADMKEKAYVVICSSENGVSWNKEITLVHAQYDCHDPKLVVSQDGSKLLVYHGITIPGDGEMRDPCTGLWTLDLDDEGKLEELSYQTVDMGSKSCYWLWGITKHQDWYYGVGYFYYDRGKPTLFRSKDGVKYEAVSEFETEGNEASPVFYGDRLYVFFRSVQTTDCFVTWADAPYTQWTEKTYNFTMHAPHAVKLWDKFFVAMRYNMYSNSICCFDPETTSFKCIHTTFTNDVSTDVGYPGMIVHDGAMHVCWYAAEKYLDKSPDIFYQSIGLGKLYGLSE